MSVRIQSATAAAMVQRRMAAGFTATRRVGDSTMASSRTRSSPPQPPGPLMDGMDGAIAMLSVRARRHADGAAGLDLRGLRIPGPILRRLAERPHPPAPAFRQSAVPRPAAGAAAARRPSACPAKATQATNMNARTTDIMPLACQPQDHLRPASSALKFIQIPSGSKRSPDKYKKFC